MENKAFNPANMSKLESKERYKILPPFKTLKLLCLKNDDIVIDIGCGIGYFSFPASDIIGERGKVVCVDISELMLKELKRKIVPPYANIEVALSENMKLPLSDAYGTFALLSNVLHEADDMPLMLSEAHRVLKSGGRIAIIEWDKREMDMGPPIEHRLHENEVLSMAIQAGFTMAKVIRVGDYHTAVLALKK